MTNEFMPKNMDRRGSRGVGVRIRTLNTTLAVTTFVEEKPKREAQIDLFYKFTAQSLFGSFNKLVYRHANSLNAS